MMHFTKAQCFTRTFNFINVCIYTSLDNSNISQKLTEVSKERDDAIKTFLPTTKGNTSDQEFSTESNTGGIKLDAMRKSKMEMLAKVKKLQHTCII